MHSLPSLPPSLPPTHPGPDSVSNVRVFVYRPNTDDATLTGLVFWDAMEFVISYSVTVLQNNVPIANVSPHLHPWLFKLPSFLGVALLTCLVCVSIPSSSLLSIQLYQSPFPDTSYVIRVMDPGSIPIGVISYPLEMGQDYQVQVSRKSSPSIHIYTI